MDYVAVTPFEAHEEEEEESALLRVQALARRQLANRALSCDQLDSNSTHTAANTTSNEHSSQYTPVSSAEVKPHATHEFRQEKEDPLAHDEAPLTRDENTAQRHTPYAPTMAATANHDALETSSHTHSVAVSQTTTSSGGSGQTCGPQPSSRLGLYRSGRGSSNSFGGSITAGIPYTGPAAIVETADACPSQDVRRTEEEEEDINETRRKSEVSPEVGLRSTNQHVDIVQSSFGAARMRRSCTPLPPDMDVALQGTTKLIGEDSESESDGAGGAHRTAEDAHNDDEEGGRGEGVPIESTLPESLRPPLKQVDAKFAEEGAIALLSFLCEENRMDVKDIPSSVFHSHCLPPMTVRNYVKRVVTYSHCSPEALLCSLILLLKYSIYSQHPVTTFNVHRLFIASILLSAKMRDDHYYSNKYYANIGGIKPKEINRLEVTFLTRLDWFICVREDEYGSLVELLETLLEVPSGAVRGPQSPDLVSQFAAEHPDVVSSYDLRSDIDDVLLQQADSEEVRKIEAATPEELNTWKLERAFRRHTWQRTVGNWLAALEDGQLAMDKHYDEVRIADWGCEEARWTRYRQADRAARSSTSSNGSSQWMSPLTVNPPTAAQWPSAVTATSSTTTPKRQQQQQQQQAVYFNAQHHNTAYSGSATRYANYPDYVQQPDSVMGSGYRYNVNHTSGTMSANATATSSASTRGSAAPTFQNYAFSASGAFSVSGFEQPHARRVSPATVARLSAQQQQPGVPVGNSSGIYGRGSLQSAAPPHQSHHSFTAWSQQRRTTSATPNPAQSSNNNNNAYSMSAAQTAAATVASPSDPACSRTATPGSRLNANAEPYRYVSSRQKKAPATSTTNSTTVTSPAQVEGQEAPARFANWRSPTEGVPPSVTVATTNCAPGYFPSAPQGEQEDTARPLVSSGADAPLSSSTMTSSAVKPAAAVVFNHNADVTSGNHHVEAEEEEWAARRRHSTSTAVPATASIAGKKRRKPQSYQDY